MVCVFKLRLDHTCSTASALNMLTFYSPRLLSAVIHEANVTSVAFGSERTVELEASKINE